MLLRWLTASGSERPPQPLRLDNGFKSRLLSTEFRTSSTQWPPRTRWQRCSRRAAPRLTVSSIRKRHYARQPATGGCDCRATCNDQAGVTSFALAFISRCAIRSQVENEMGEISLSAPVQNPQSMPVSGMRPSGSGLIAKKPWFLFGSIDISGLIMAVVLYFSGTPSGMIVLTTIASLALVNAVLIIMRRVVVSDIQAATGAEVIVATPPKKRAWLLLLLGLYMLGNSLFQVANPKLPSDRPLGYIIPICSPAILLTAWREFRKRPPHRNSAR